MSSQILTYLSALEQNNDREWYHAHKAELTEANREFEEIIGGLIAEIGKVDGSILYNVPKDLTFKLVRDTRFSHLITRPSGATSHRRENCRFRWDIFCISSRGTARFWEADFLRTCLRMPPPW